MSDGIMLVFGEDGVAREYDDTWDITIHCESEEEQKAVWEKLNNLNREVKNLTDTISRQAAIDAIKALWNNAPSAQHVSAMFDCEDAIRALPSAQPEQKWIPCSERLPEDEYVLISKKPSKISGSKWCVTIAIRAANPRSKKVQWRDIAFGVIPDDKILAWMPLPEPYRGE